MLLVYSNRPTSGCLFVNTCSLMQTERTDMQCVLFRQFGKLILNVLKPHSNGAASEGNELFFTIIHMGLKTILITFNCQCLWFGKVSGVRSKALCVSWEVISFQYPIILMGIYDNRQQVRNTSDAHVDWFERKRYSRVNASGVNVNDSLGD